MFRREATATPKGEGGSPKIEPGTVSELQALRGSVRKHRSTAKLYRDAGDFDLCRRLTTIAIIDAVKARRLARRLSSASP